MITFFLLLSDWQILNEDGQEAEEEEEEQEAEQEEEQEEEQCLATFLRHGSPDIKHANIIENPRYSFHSDEESSSTGNAAPATVSATATADGATSAVSSDTGAAAVDYDRIISFLGILKETSA